MKTFYLLNLDGQDSVLAFDNLVDVTYHLVLIPCSLTPIVHLETIAVPETEEEFLKTILKKPVEVNKKFVFSQETHKFTPVNDEDISI